MNLSTNHCHLSCIVNLLGLGASHIYNGKSVRTFQLLLFFFLKKKNCILDPSFNLVNLIFEFAKILNLRSLATSFLFFLLQINNKNDMKISLRTSFQLKILDKNWKARSHLFEFFFL
jgi:hypothetical protein